MAGISKKWLREHGVSGNDETLEDIAHHAEAALVLIIRDALVASLDESQYQLFVILYEGQDNLDSQLVWLKQYCPNYQQIVELVTADFKKAIAASEYPITFILGQADK